MKALLLSSPTASQWSAEARAEWWKIFAKQTGQEPVPRAETGSDSTPIETVRIDLGSRMDRLK
jgi:hypothetical protein